MPQLFEFDTVEENLALAKSLNLDFIELNLNFSYCREALEGGKLAALLEQYGIEATLHFYDEADFASYDEVVDAYLSLLKRYARLGKGCIRQLNVHLNPGPVVTISGVKNYIYDKEYDSYIVRLISNLKKTKEICESNSMNLVIENVDITPEYLKKTYVALKESGFHFCYDIGHDHLSNDVVWNLQQDLDLPFDEFHIHDAKQRTKCHLCLGDGELDIRRFKELAVRNNAYVVLEVKQSKDLRRSVPLFNAIEI